MASALIILIVVIVAIVGFVIVLYNGLVQRRLRVDEAFAQIEVQLKRRHDLIPNLVNAVKGYMDFEQDVLTKVTEGARVRLPPALRVRPSGRRPENLLTAPCARCSPWSRTIRS